MALSSNSPEEPPITTLLSVKSEIFAVDATNPLPPEISTPPLASIAAANVETPAVTFKPSLAVTSPTESIFVTS